MDLSSSYMGIAMDNPIVATSTPLTKEGVDAVMGLVEAGAGAIVLHSLFEEQIEMEGKALVHNLERGSESFPEALTYFPRVEDFKMGPEEYLRLIQEVKRRTYVPVIGSINGTTLGGWVKYARLIEEAGADGLELNLYLSPIYKEIEGKDLEDILVSLVKEVRRQTSLPLSVKISPFFTSIPNVCHRLVRAGANGLALFNRFYEPDLDLKNMELVMRPKLSSSYEMLLPMRWIAALYGKIEADFLLTTGVKTGLDAAKALAVGARAVGVASAILQNGPSHIGKMLEELKSTLEELGYGSARELVGVASNTAIGDPLQYEFERIHYMKVLLGYDPDHLY